MITTETADNALRSYYLGAVADQLDKSINPLLARIKMTTSDVWGKDVRKAVRFGVNGGIGAGKETGNLPIAGSNRYAQFVATLKNLYGVIEISDKAIRSSQNAEGAFVNLLNDEMDGLVKSSSFNFGRMLFGDGTGLLATVTGVDAAQNTKLKVDSVRNFAEGMIVDVYNASGTSVASARVIEAVDHTNKAITLSGATLSSPTGHKIYMQRSKDIEITGLGAIFGTNDLYGVSRADNEWMNPYQKEDVGALSEEVIQKAIDEVEMRSGSKINFIVCSWGVRRALIKLLSAYRTTDTMVLEGGFKAISYNGIPVVADRFCPEGTMYLLNTDDFALHQLCDWQWLESEGGKILKQIAGKPTYNATLVKYAELMCYRPCGQAALKGITEA